MPKHRSADALVLVTWANVQMIEQQAMLTSLDHDEAYAGSVEYNVMSVFGNKAEQEALSCSNWIEPPEALQALAHGFDPQGSQGLGVSRSDTTEFDDWDRLRHVRAL
ncbi:hypothetical protein ANRL1_02237 [Anaerolineae bacterium]|nr:hypothetical protein ANRL1_02237 [Anaerolineae bacterium]